VLVYCGLVEECLQIVDSVQLKGVQVLTEEGPQDDAAFFEERKTRFKISFEQEPAYQQVQTFDNSGFAMFKGRTWRYFMPKLYCVIGRSPLNYKASAKKIEKVKVVWHVDIDLATFANQKKVSRQHALVAFNFHRQHFEIKCLSRKYPVMVNRQTLAFGEEPRPLKSGDIVAVAQESFFFMLPPGQPPITDQQIDQPEEAIVEQEASANKEE